MFVHEQLTRLAVVAFVVGVIVGVVLCNVFLSFELF